MKQPELSLGRKRTSQVGSIPTYSRQKMPPESEFSEAFFFVFWHFISWVYQNVLYKMWKFIDKISE